MTSRFQATLRAPLEILKASPFPQSTQSFLPKYIPFLSHEIGASISTYARIDYLRAELR